MQNFLFYTFGMELLVGCLSTKRRVRMPNLLDILVFASTAYLGRQTI